MQQFDMIVRMIFRRCIAARCRPCAGKRLHWEFEDVSVVAGPRVAPATATARLDLVESLGNETFIYARTGRHDLTARISPTQTLPPLGGNVVLAFNLERAHFFDAVNGERVG